MKKFRQLLAAVMAIVIFVTAVPFVAGAQQIYTDDVSQAQLNDEFAGYGTGNQRSSAGLSDDVPVISSVSDYYNFVKSDKQGDKDIAVTGANTLPKSVDNSLSPYFPAITNQGSLGSCVAFSCVYYQFTYEMNRARGVATTTDNTFSPKWAYNILSRGTDTGINFERVYNLLNQHGCPFNKSFPYDGKDFVSWSTDERVWREAIRYRLDTYQVFEGIGKDSKEITSNDDADLLAIKTAIANGDVLSCATFMSSWQYKKLKTNEAVPENSKFPNEQYLRTMNGTSGDHRITIVGYNDDIWCDINDNGAVDDGEMGALKIANSWGTSYGNKGFSWVAYDALNDVSCVEGTSFPSTRKRALTDISRIDVKPAREGNDIYIKFTANTANRSKFYAIFSASLHGTEYQRYLLESAKDFSTTDNYAFNGTTNACDATFIYPLDDLSPTLTTGNFEDHDFSITIKDVTSDSSTVIVKNVSLVNEYTGKEYKVNSGLPVTLNKSEWTKVIKEHSTKNVVVYYMGFDEPYLHYKSSGGSFTKVKMEKNDERHGYYYKYVIEDINQDVAIYFSDGNGSIDNNNGAYYTATNGLNYYFTKGQREELTITDMKISNGTPDIGKRCYFDIDVTGGYEPYQYKYTFEDINTGEIVKTVKYNVKYENDPFRYLKETTYKVTLEVMDYAQQTTSSSILVTVEDQPFVIESIAQDKTNGLVSKEITFASITAFEGLLSGPHKPESRFVIKDSSGKVWYDEIIKYSSADYRINSTTTICGFTPQKAGKYTLTVSSTDYNKDYAEKTIDFTVSDMITGDADGNGLVSVMDATTIQRYLANLVANDGIYTDLADCDTNDSVNVLDATYIQRYMASLSGSANVGKVISYTPIIDPVDPPTEAPTTPPVLQNQVTFTNSLNWSGTIYCYYWSDSNTQMTSWPGKSMTKSGTNEYGETLYTFDVPKDVKYIIFTNGSAQTVDITYPGGVVKYYAQSSKTGNGYNVGTW